MKRFRGCASEAFPGRKARAERTALAAVSGSAAHGGPTGSSHSPHEET